MRIDVGEHVCRVRTVRVLVCEEQALVLAGLRATVAGLPDIELVGEAGGAEQLIELSHKLRPDVVLLGVPLADSSLIPTIRRVVAASGGASPSIVIMSYESDEAELLAAVRIGVRGVVSRRSSPAELLRDVRVVAAGGAALTPSMTGRLVDFAMSALPGAGEPPPSVAALTRREQEVLALVAQGLTDSAIADAFWVSKATVRSHVHRVLHKLGVSSRAQAVAYYYQHGLAGCRPARRREAAHQP